MNPAGTAPQWRRRVRALSLAALAGLTVATMESCSPRERVPLPPSAPVITVGMRDFAFDLVAEVDAGRSVFRARNTGEHPHELYLIPVPDDAPPAQEAFGPSGVRQPRAPAASLKPVAPGRRGSFAFDLAPGRYSLVCLLKTSDGRSHETLGMAADVRVRPVDGGTRTAPTSTTTSVSGTTVPTPVDGTTPSGPSGD